jgi:hypothetical protein
MAKKVGQRFTSIPRQRFDGGVNYTFGSRQIADNESPDAVNCDFKGKTGVGNRMGYTQLGEPSTYDEGKGLAQFHTSSIDQAIKFVSNGTNCILSYSTGGAWTDVTGTTFTSKNIDTCQGASKLFTGNGTEVMRHWNGSAWADTTNGTKGYYPTYFNSRVWVKDEENEDMLNFSGQYGASDNGESGGATTDKLGDFTDASAGWIRFKPGSGAKINGLVTFKNALYVLLSDSIYTVAPATEANTFTVTLLTNSVGCVSHRSIKQVEEDIYFAGDDGVYSLGDVANYTTVRTTNKSGKVQRIFDGLSATQKAALVGAYFNFKYYLFYQRGSATNDACLVYDIRYKAWQDWRNISANDAKVITLANARRLFFIEPLTAEVQELGVGTTDDGAPINSYWTSKSFDEEIPDVMKFYFDTSFLFGTLSGSVTASVIFNDTEVAVTKALSQNKPMGGFGRNVVGDGFPGAGTFAGVAGALVTTQGGLGFTENTVTVVQAYNFPQRLKAKGKKYAIQYKVSSTNFWRLDSISQYVSAFDHFKILPSLKLN